MIVLLRNDEKLKIMAFMKPEELAKRLGITSAALRKWAGKDYAPFLGPSAQGLNGARRSFSEQDARIIAWIVQLKNDNTSAKEINSILRNAQSQEWQDLPPMPLTDQEEVALVPREAVEERIQGLQGKYEQQLQAVIKERDELASRLAKMEADNAELRQKLMELTDRVLDLNGRLTSMLEKEQKRRK